MATLLLWWLVVGPALSWKRVQVGRQVVWIGAVVSISQEVLELSVGKCFVEDLSGEVEDLCCATAVIKAAG